MKCPLCKIENIPGSRYCDCGYDFTENKLHPEKARRDVFTEPDRPREYRPFLGGGLVGLLINEFRYYNAQPRQRKSNFYAGVKIIGIFFAILALVFAFIVIGAGLGSSGR